MATALLPPCDEVAGRAETGGTCHSETGTLIATVLGSSLAFVVGSIINVALPAMRDSFGTDAAGVQWIVNAYLLPLSALVLVGGRARGSLWSQTLLHDRPRGLHAGDAGLCFGAHPANLAWRALRAGNRCRAARAQQPRHYRRWLFGREAGQGGRNMGSGRCHRRGRRAADRRTDRRSIRLALGLRDRHPARCSCMDRRPARHPGVDGERRRARAARPIGCGAGDACARRARIRADQRARSGAGSMVRYSPHSGSACCSQLRF